MMERFLGMQFFVDPYARFNRLGSEMYFTMSQPVPAKPNKQKFQENKMVRYLLYHLDKPIPRCYIISKKGELEDEIHTAGL